MTAMVGTGLVTLGVALTGMAGMTDDLRAAGREAAPKPPALLTNEEVRETLRLERLSEKQRANCLNRQKAREQITGTTGPREL